ncbi:MAG: hypothetical protein IJN63_10720 [Clostridia bacterium]|nr:hypothetical protein [Clostridia bacterium]
MKKTVVCCILLLLAAILLSCNNGGGDITVVTDPLPDVGKTVPVVSAPADTEPPVTEPPVTEPPVTEPPVMLPELKFFLDDLSGTFAVMDSFKGPYVQGRDVGCFGIIPDVDIDGKKSYRSYWNAAIAGYSALADLRVAYVLEFELASGERVTVPIDSAADTEGEYNKYLEVYIYDDVHQVEGQFYSHLLEWQMNDSTLITSVKLTGGPEIDKVGDIRLTVYLYAPAGDLRYAETCLPISRAE